MSDKKTHFIFRVSKDPCDDATEFYAGNNTWSFKKEEALLMPEMEADEESAKHHTQSMVAGIGTFTYDHFLL